MTSCSPVTAGSDVHFSLSVLLAGSFAGTRGKAFLWALWQNALSSINLHGVGIRRWGKKKRKAPVSTDRCVSELREYDRQTCGTLCPLFLLFLLGLLLSWALTPTTDKKMIKHHGPKPNPALSRLSCRPQEKLRLKLFPHQNRSFNSFFITFSESHIWVFKAAWLAAWNPFTAHYLSQCAPWYEVQTWRRVNTGSGSENSPLYLTWISHGWHSVKHKHTRTHTYYMYKGRFSPQGSAVDCDIPLVKYLNVHENGNGSSWSVSGDQSASSSGLFIKLEHYLLVPVILPVHCLIWPWGGTVNTV